MKKHKLLFVFFILIFVVIMPIQVNAEKLQHYTDLFKNVMIINNSDVITNEQSEDVNKLLLEISENKGKNIYIYITEENEINDIRHFILEMTNDKNNKNDYIIVLEPYTRELAIYNYNKLIDATQLNNKYSKDEFKANDFYTGIVNLAKGISSENENFELFTNNTAEEFETVPEIKLSSHITDFKEILTPVQEEEIETVAYKLKQNYGVDIYVILSNAIENYGIDNYAHSIFRHNFSYKSNVILLVFSLEEGNFSYVNSPNINMDIISIYNNYAKTYFHLEEPDYVTGINKLMSAIVANYKFTSISNIENSIISGKTVSIGTTDTIKNFLKLTALVLIIITLIVVIIYFIYKIIKSEKIEKKLLLNNHPERAFANLEKEINKDSNNSTEQLYLKIVNNKMDELYKEVASELTNEEIKSKKIEKSVKDNIFGSEYEEKNNDLVIESIDEMILKIVKKASGTKEWYDQLQSALDIYNNLSFTNRTKLNRNNTSQLEALTRKAKLDKEMSERKL